MMRMFRLTNEPCGLGLSCTPDGLSCERTVCVRLSPDRHPLDTLTVNNIKNPQKIFEKVERYVDAAVNYEQSRELDLAPALISSKTIQLAIPEWTSPTQWQYLLRAIIYGKDNGVSIVITRIRE